MVSVPAAAQPAPPVPPGPPSWTPAARFDLSPPLRDIPATPAVSTRQSFAVKLPPLPQEPAQSVNDASLQSTSVGMLAAVAGNGFDGVGEGNTQFSYNVNYAPPDTTGEASATQFVQWVNPSFAVFDKSTGTRLYGPAGGNTIWTGFGGPCETRNDGDPVVQWDQLAERWVVSQFALQSGNYMECVAVSQTADATGAWYRYAFSYAEFPDYPKLSVWPDAYYVTFNMFGATGSTFTGARVCAYDRAKMLAGQAATQICYQLASYASLLAADLDGTTPPPAGTAAYIMNRSSSQLRVWRFVPNFANPASSTLSASPSLISVNAFSTCSGAIVPQPGTTNRLDGLCDRMMYRVAYRNLGTRQALLASHTVASGTVTGVRWYELNAGTGTPTIRQQGTYAPADGLYRWMSSIAMDKVGNIGLGYSVGNAATKASIRFAGRESTDTLGTLSSETSIQVGTGSQTGTLTRWGDYSHMAIDPVDDCTFWFTTEYLKADGTFNWSTRVGSFSFPSCTTAPPPAAGFSLAVTPSSRAITVGQSTTFAATVTPLNGYTGAGSFSVTGLPAGASASWSSAGYTGGSGSSTLTVATTAGTTPAGSYALTITAADSTGTPTQSSTVTLTVNPLPNFTVSVSPTSRSLRRGRSTSVTASVAAVGGFNEAVTWSASGLPLGVSATFTPTSITGSGSSTVTLRATNTATITTVPVTIRGTSTSGLQRTATLTLSITR